MHIQKRIYGGDSSESHIQVSFLQSKNKLTVSVFFLQYTILYFVNQNFSFQCLFSIYSRVCQPYQEAEITLVLQPLCIKNRLPVGVKVNKSFVTPSGFWRVDRLSKLLKKQAHKQILTSCPNCTNKRFVYNLLLLFQTLSVTSPCMGFGILGTFLLFLFCLCLVVFNQSYSVYGMNFLVAYSSCYFCLNNL